MDNAKELKEYAKKVIEIALNENRLEYVLKGDPLFKIEYVNLDREKEFAANIIMDTLYELNLSNPGIGKLTEEKLVSSILTSKLPEYINNYLKLVTYHLYAEKNDIATFKMDCKKILENLNTNLQNNKEIYNRQIYKDIGFDKMINDHDQYLSANYGYHIR